jgi:hypothetical protein
MRNTDPLITSLIIIFILGVWFYAYQTFRPQAAVETHNQPATEEILKDTPAGEKETH